MFFLIVNFTFYTVKQENLISHMTGGKIADKYNPGNRCEDSGISKMLGYKRKIQLLMFTSVFSTIFRIPECLRLSRMWIHGQ